MGQRNKRTLAQKAALSGVLALGGLTLSGCEVAPPEAVSKILGFGWPTGVTPEAHAMYNFWVWVWVLAWTIGIIMWGLFLLAIFRWTSKRAEKEGRGEFPKALQYNVPLEIALTVVPVIIIMTLFFFNVQTQQKVVALDKDPEVTVDVTAFQWNWKFGYANVSAALSSTGAEYDGTDEERNALAEKSAVDPEGMPNANPIHGASMGDISYLNFNDIETLGEPAEIPVLVLPTHTPIEFRLASGDVSHAFWVPEFLFKRDTYAHPENNQQERRFQIAEITEEGAFVGRCAEMCGTYHSMMNFEVRAVSRADFESYMQYRINNPEAPNSAALASIGQEPYATTTHPFNSSRTDTRGGQNDIDANAKA
ncbi:MAG: cytochrome c oxidase subunit II [Corynebacterium sp.]|nr:cytochrome c oxidase subunit II [Corynebacterium sp.]